MLFFVQTQMSFVSVNSVTIFKFNWINVKVFFQLKFKVYHVFQLKFKVYHVFQLKFKVYHVFQCAQLKICLCQINVFYAYHSNFIFDKREFKIFLELSRIITSKN